MMLAAHIELILLLTGLATAGALVLFLAPVPVLSMLFGQEPSDGLSVLVARQWGLLVFLVGALLVYAVYHPEVRVPVLILAGVEKVVFGVSVFLSPFRRRSPATGVALADVGMATLYVLILAGV
jgi:hypothetical protein